MSEAYAMSIDEIVVGERRRQDYGDIDGLVESIERWGLLHPIVIDESNRLVAGGRRLEACRRLGWSSVPVRNVGDLSESELREVELEENLRRKDLTQYEQSKVMVALVATTREIVQEETTGEPAETRANVTQVNRGSRGPAQTPGSLRDVSARTGIPEPTIRRAEAHVAAVDRYPELQHIPQREALTIAKNLDQLPEPVRAEKRQALQSDDSDTWTELADLPPMPKGKTPKQIADEDPGQKWLGALGEVSDLILKTRDNGDIEAIAHYWSNDRRREYIGELQSIDTVIQGWVTWLEESIHE